MLDDETLREVGRLVIEFNTLEELITALAAAIFECTEWATAEYLRKRDTSQKLGQIRDVCNILAEAYELQGKPPFTSLLSQIKEKGTILKLLKKRNAVIHGEVTIKRGERPCIQSKQSTVELSPEALSVLVQEADRATADLLAAYYNFMDAVGKAREARDAAARPTGIAQHNVRARDPRGPLVAPPEGGSR